MEPLDFDQIQSDILAGKYDQELAEILGDGDYMHMAKAHHGLFNFGENFSFKKTGKEIAEKAGSVIERLHKEIEEKKKSVVEICKKREIDIEAAIDEADIHHEDLGSSKAYSNVAAVLNNAAAKAMEAIQADIRKVQETSREIIAKKTLVTELERLKRNVDPTQSFTLHWGDLVTLNF